MAVSHDDVGEGLPGVRIADGARASFPAPTPTAARDLIVQAHRCLKNAASADRCAERYAAAHLAALRGAAAVLATRARPTGRATAGMRNAWALLTCVAPELGEWALFFASGAPKRAAAEAGLIHAVNERDADDLLRDVSHFLEICESMLGMPAPRGGTRSKQTA